MSRSYTRLRLDCAQTCEFLNSRPREILPCKLLKFDVFLPGVAPTPRRRRACQALYRTEAVLPHTASPPSTKHLSRSTTQAQRASKKRDQHFRQKDHRLRVNRATEGLGRGERKCRLQRTTGAASRDARLPTCLQLVSGLISGEAAHRRSLGHDTERQSTRDQRGATTSTADRPSQFETQRLAPARRPTFAPTSTSTPFIHFVFLTRGFLPNKCANSKSRIAPDLAFNPHSAQSTTQWPPSTPRSSPARSRSS